MPFKNKEDLIKNGKKYYKENKESIRLKQALYRLKNLEAEQKRHRKFNILKYGITEDDYLKIFEKQKGLCKICGNPSPRIRLHIDHCHKNNNIRGLLCENCNRGLGMFKENQKILKLAIKYLKKYDI